jgi:hypothetical protein
MNILELPGIGIILENSTPGPLKICSVSQTRNFIPGP